MHMDSDKNSYRLRRRAALFPQLVQLGTTPCSDSSSPKVPATEMSAAPRTLLTTLRGAVRSRGGPANSPRPRTAPANALQIRSLASAVEAAAPGKGWTREQVQQVYDSPLMELIFRAVSRLRQDRRPNHFLLPRIREPDDWLTQKAGPTPLRARTLLRTSTTHSMIPRRPLSTA